VVGFSGGGSDRAWTWDSTGPDRFLAARYFAQIVGRSSIYRALGFSSVTALGTAGGLNRRRLDHPAFDLFQVGRWI
jgi:hypothetical protein